MIVTLDEMKALLGIDPLNTDDDAYLTTELTNMNSVVEQYCERGFTRQDYTDTFEDVESATIFVYAFPITAVTRVSIDGVDADLTNVKVNKSQGSICLREGTLYGAEEVIVEYNGGFDPIPGDVKRVVSDLVHSRYNNKFINDPTRRIRSEGIPDVANYIYERSYAFDKEAILGAYAMLLDKYRSLRVFI